MEIGSFISRLGGKSFTVTHNIWNAGEIAVEGPEIRVWGLFDPDDDTKPKARGIPEISRRRLGKPAMNKIEKNAGVFISPLHYGSVGNNPYILSRNRPSFSCTGWSVKLNRKASSSAS